MSQAVILEQQYRPDIDGLRALAIVPVVLFHAGWTFFSGGYVGVDVFFVISGYLITSLILREFGKGSFSLSGFWARRARRILPALGVVVLFTLIAGWIIFFPSDYKGVGREVLTQAFFSSNVYFWLESGYFTSPSETKPLLHTWSLSVEEQYYLVMPLILYVLTRYAKQRAAWIVLVLLVCSFCVSVWWSYRYPDAAFFLAPSRAWELLLGALLAMLTLRKARGKSPAHARKELMSATGLAAIWCAAVLYDKSTRLPGVAALVPV